MKKTFKQLNIDGITFNLLDLPHTGLYKIQIMSKKGAHIEKLLEQDTGKNLYGISHLIEHISFKRTKDYSTEELWILLRNEGKFNASTWHDKINYWFKTTLDRSKLANKIVCNIAFNDLKSIPEFEFIIERDTVYNESKKAHDNESSMFYRNAKIKISNYNKEDNVIWIPETIKTFSLEDVISAKKYFLTRSNHIINITFDSSLYKSEDEIISDFLCEFKRFELRNEDIIMNNRYTNIQSNFNIWTYCVKNNWKQKLNYLLLDVIDDIYTSNYTTQFINTLSGNSSLFHLIREKNWLSYSPTMFESLYSGKNVVVFTCDVTRGNEGKMLSLLIQSINESVDNFTPETHKKLLDTMILNRMISFVNQNNYEMLFHFSIFDNKTYLNYKISLSNDIDKAFIEMDKMSASYENIKSQLDLMKTSINEKKYIIVTN